MDDKQKQIIIWLILGLILVGSSVIMEWEQGYTWPHMLCDGFFLAAVIILGSGGLKFIRNKGTFDVMSYSVSSVIQLYNPFSKLRGKQEDFVEYRDRKSAKRTSAAEMLWAGLVYLVLAVIMLVVYLLIG